MQLCWPNIRLLSLSASVLLLAACGGADTTHQLTKKSALRTVSPKQSTAGERPLQSTAVVKPSPFPADLEALFEWAEEQYPTLFPRGASTQPGPWQFEHFSLRHYQSTDNTIGVTRGGVAYGLGPFTNWEIVPLGPAERYLCQSRPEDCAPRTRTTIRVAIVAGTQQCQPDSGTPLLAERRRLLGAGIPVVTSSCTWSTGGVPAACGLWDRRYWTFDIDAAHLQTAQELGFEVAHQDAMYGDEGPLLWPCDGV